MPYFLVIELKEEPPAYILDQKVEVEVDNWGPALSGTVKNIAYIEEETRI